MYSKWSSTTILKYAREPWAEIIAYKWITWKWTLPWFLASSKDNPNKNVLILHEKTALIYNEIIRSKKQSDAPSSSNKSNTIFCKSKLRNITKRSTAHKDFIFLINQIDSYLHQIAKAFQLAKYKCNQVLPIATSNLNGFLKCFTVTHVSIEASNANDRDLSFLAWVTFDKILKPSH